MPALAAYNVLKVRFERQPAAKQPRRNLLKIRHPPRNRTCRLSQQICEPVLEGVQGAKSSDSDRLGRHPDSTGEDVYWCFDLNDDSETKK